MPVFLDTYIPKPSNISTPRFHTPEHFDFRRTLSPVLASCPSPSSVHTSYSHSNSSCNPPSLNHQPLRFITLHQWQRQANQHPSGIVPKHWGIVADAIKRRRYAQPGCSGPSGPSGTLWWLPAGCLGRDFSLIGLILRDTPAVWGAGMTCGSGFRRVVLTVVSVVFHRDGRVSAGDAILGYSMSGEFLALCLSDTSLLRFVSLLLFAEYRLRSLRQIAQKKSIGTLPI
jgi:hypothetical protein